MTSSSNPFSSQEKGDKCDIVYSSLSCEERAGVRCSEVKTVMS